MQPPVTAPWLKLKGAVGGNLQTVWSALFASTEWGQPIAYQRERWSTPDHDFIDLDWLDSSTSKTAPLLIFFHGLEGTSRSHYALAFASWARHNGWRFVVPHFRGCSGEINLAPRAYHSGDHEEIHWILTRLRAQHTGPMLALGASLGGNALLCWAAQAGQTAAQTVEAIGAISAPVDLTASGHAIGAGFNRQTYNRMFLRTMVPKALKKAQQYPGLINPQALQQCRDLFEFDNLFTAPLHGYQNTDDYWQRASSKPHLHQIQIPALLLNARNDPFVPGISLPNAIQNNQYLTLWQPEHGGHVGFPKGPWPGQVFNLPNTIMPWLCTQAQLPHQSLN
jgi:uncharacterized protein